MKDAFNIKVLPSLQEDMEDFNLSAEIGINQYLQFFKGIDEVLLKAINDKGLSTDPEFITANIQRIQIEGNEFDHYWFHYGQPDAIRIISIESKPRIVWHDSQNGSARFITHKTEAKYY